MLSSERRLARQLFYGFMIGVASFLLHASPSQAEQLADTEREARLRSAFIYNFASFTEWPAAGEQEKFRVAIWKNTDASDAAKKELAGKSIKGKPIEISLITGDEAVSGIKLIVIDSDATETDLRKLISSLGASPTLTVSRFENHCNSGVIVCFYKELDKLRFKVNKTALDKSALKMSSQLLKLARIVEN